MVRFPEILLMVGSQVALPQCYIDYLPSPDAFTKVGVIDPAL